MGFFGNIGRFFKKSFKSLSNPVKYLGDLGSALMGKDAFSDYDGSLGVLGNLGGTIQDFWKDYTGQTIAEKNLKFQEKQLKEQQWLNREQMKREDNAMVRKVADLKNAGLNPVLAANGTGAPSAPLHAGTAPQLDDYSGGAREGLSQLSSLVLNAISMKKDFAVKDAEIQKMKSEKEYFDTLKGKVSAETTGLNIDNESKARFNEVRIQSIDLDNQLKSGTLQNNILMSYKKLRQVDLDYENSKLDGMLKKLNISHEQVMITQDQLKNKLYVQDSEIKELVVTAKTVEILRSVAEYNSFLFDVDFYNRLHGLPVGYNIPMVGRVTDYTKGLLGSAWNELKEFVGGNINLNRLSNTINSLVSNTEKMLDDVAESLGTTKNELIFSFRRGEDGVRRNQGMFYVGGRH